MKKFLYLLTFLCLSASMGFAQMVDVTFSVDISEVTNLPASSTVSVFGSFNGWDSTANPLTDDNSDGVWTATLPLALGNYEYKFFITGTDGTLEETFMGGEPCTLTTDIFTNRTLAITEATTLPVVCWESCNECGFVPTTSMVTFSVNMNEYGPLDEARLAGSFNGWDAASNPMTDADSDGVWETTIALEDGNYEYKFVALVGENNNFEDVVAGTPCTLTTGEFTNRLVVVSGDATLGTVCYGSCDDCGTVNTPSMVTFSVNMNEYGPLDEARLAGSFNGWDAASNPMTDADSDGIWETTIELANATYEYKFVALVGEDNNFEELEAGSSCTLTTGEFTNRLIVVDADATLGTVCYSSCSDCAVAVDELSVLGIDFRVSPTVANSEVQLTFGRQLPTNSFLQVLNMSGQVVQQLQMSQMDNYRLDVSQLSTGMYFLQLQSGEAITVRRMIKQ